MILFINACVRKDSRTVRLAEDYLRRQQDTVEEVKLRDISFPVTDEEFLSRRDRLCAEGRFDDPALALARQFASADSIVIAAPYWDLSFPASLKQYFEQVSVTGITFTYSPEGIPQGLCKAEKLVYITTSGGDQVPWDYGYGYVKALAETLFGIEDVRLIKAAGLDLDGTDPEVVLAESIRQYTSEDNTRKKRERFAKMAAPVMMAAVFVVYLIGFTAALFLTSWSPLLLMLIVPLIAMGLLTFYMLKNKKGDGIS